MWDTIVSPVPPAGIDARQGMFRVWLVISGVWVAFWLAIAAIVVFTVEMRASLVGELGLYSVIVLAPPLALLGIGVLCRWVFETVRAYRGKRHVLKVRAPRVVVDHSEIEIGDPAENFRDKRPA